LIYESIFGLASELCAPLHVLNNDSHGLYGLESKVQKNKIFNFYASG